MRYERSPESFFEDSIFSPPLLPRMLTKPRTVCGCQPVAFMISANVAPLARFISVITSAFLLARSAFGLLFLARLAFFRGFAFLVDLRFYDLLLRQGQPVYYVFDLLWLNGKDLRFRPLVEGKRILRSILQPQPLVLLYADHIEQYGVDFFRLVCERDWKV